MSLFSHTHIVFYTFKTIVYETLCKGPSTIISRMLLHTTDIQSASFFFNWNIVDLWYCVSFRCTARWFGYTCIYVYIYNRQDLKLIIWQWQQCHNCHMVYAIKDILISELLKYVFKKCILELVEKDTSYIDRERGTHKH